mgnify:CR=1 FL=1
MRNNFAAEVAAVAKEDERVFMIAGDIGNRLFDDTKAVTGNRFLNAGIAEQSMMGVAAGLALSGFRPIVYTITPFTTYRNFEQIRVDVCYHKAPVIIVGTGAGLSYSSLGPTHHSMEDVAILRTLPGMTIFCPADPQEVRAGLRAALKQDGPVYIRLGKKGEPNLHADMPQIVFGKAITMREGSDVCLVASGSVVGMAIQAADKLKEAGISARVENFHTIKPLDTQRLADLSKKFKTLIVVEEHGHIGGLYGAIAEWFGLQPGEKPLLKSIGSKDDFLHEIGGQGFARKHYGITVDAIVKAAS